MIKIFLIDYYICTETCIEMYKKEHDICFKNISCYGMTNFSGFRVNLGKFVYNFFFKLDNFNNHNV